MAKLRETYGPIIGYKAAFTSVPSQQRFNIPRPLVGQIYKDLIRTDGARVPSKFGARPFFEADFVAIVKGPAIHKATTALEALAEVEAVAPFIELVDLAVAPDVKMDGPTIVAINVAHRGGVLGKSFKAESTQAFLDRLAAMTVVTTDDTGKELARDSGRSMLDNPANVILFMAQELPKLGITLKPGDLLSLGSFPGPLQIQAGRTVTVTYAGLPGDPSVRATFE